MLKHRKKKGVQSNNQQPGHKNFRSRCYLNSRDWAQAESGGLKQLDALDIGVQCCICPPRRGNWRF